MNLYVVIYLPNHINCIGSHFACTQMASTTSAFVAAVASAFIAVHRAGLLELIVELGSAPLRPAPKPVLIECPRCWLGTDETLPIFRELLARGALHNDRRVEVVAGVIAVLSLTGLVATCRGIFRCCCSRGGVRVEARFIRVSHGDRRPQRA